MKLVSLNTWGAAQGELFFDYIKSQIPSTDIFCFQEIYTANATAPRMHGKFYIKQFAELSKLMPDFVPVFDPKSFDHTDHNPSLPEWSVALGSCIFFRKKYSAEFYLSKVLLDSVPVGTPVVEGLIKAQILGISAEGKRLNIINTHGISRPGGKLDTPERILQSQRIGEILPELNGEVVLCGDFNLMPNTESVRILEKELKNLITEYKIENTRNEITWAKYPDKQHFADFTFVSGGIRVKNFEVPYNLASDHLPMELEFEIK